ncbi:MAG TPA: YHS domain-containing protein [Gemmata sp.]|nr:YHS domain-containing protein [Gemmata sp.]
MRTAILALFVLAADSHKIDLPANAKAALQPFNSLVGSWRCSGAPEGTRDERAAGAWNETDHWVWQFKDTEAWLAVTFDKGKHFIKGELHYTPEKDQARYTLKLTAADKSTATFVGSLTEKGKLLTLDRTDPPAGEEQRIVFSLLHHNRHLYRFETRPAGTKIAFERKWQVGATKEGVPFADVPKGPECIVSGGLGTMKVTYKGKTYWVCCSGCRDEFKENPEKYIKEFEAKAKDKK